MKQLLATTLCLCVFVLGLFLFQDCAYASNNGVPVVVSMGDSYSSGEGVEEFYDQGESNKYASHDWLAHRSTEAWPGLLRVGSVNKLRDIKDKGWYFIASSGAKTNHLRGTDDSESPHDKAGTQTKKWKGWNSFPKENGSDTLPCQLEVFKSLPEGAAADYVTLTIGGNDLGFADIIAAACTNSGLAYLLGQGNLDAEINQAIRKFESDDFTKNLLDTYSTVSDAAGAQAHLIVAGYPHLFPEEGRKVNLDNGFLHWFNQVTPIVGGSVSAEDAKIINRAVDLFDVGVGKLIGGTQKEQWHFVDPREEFNGQESDYINAIWNYAQQEDLDQTDNSAYSAHPTKEGQEAYARVVQKVIDDIESDGASQGNSGAPITPAITTDFAISLVFDVSGSMDDQSATGSTKLAEAKNQSIDFVNAINHASSDTSVSNVQVGVASYATSGYEDCPLSTDPDQVNTAINNLSARGGTNMYSGLEIGINQLRATDGEKMMVFLSDGLNNEGHTDQEVEDLARQAADEGIKIFTIGFGPSGDLNEQLLRSIASITGGTYSHEDASDMNRAAVGVFSTMLEASMSSRGTVVYSATGSVMQDQTTQTGTFQVDENGILTSYLYWPGSVLDMILLDPKGVEVEEGYPGFSIDTSTIPTTITVTNAAVGTWTMSVFGRDVSMENEPFWVGSVLTPSPVQEATPTGGGGSTNNAGGLLILLLVVAIAAIGGVYALSIRKRNDKKEKDLYG